VSALGRWWHCASELGELSMYESYCLVGRTVAANNECQEKLSVGIDRSRGILVSGVGSICAYNDVQSRQCSAATRLLHKDTRGHVM
jgi:hypothetical protein